MEDQPTAGSAVNEDPEAPESDVTEPEAVETEVSEPEAAEPDSADPEPKTGARSLSRLWAAALIAAAVLFIAGAGFAGASMRPYLVDRATVATKERVASAAAEALTTLWTYTPDDIDGMPARADRYLAGDLAEQFQGLMGSVVPESKQAQVSKTTVVVGTAVEALTDNEATVVVYTNTTNSSPLTKNIPQMVFCAYRVAMQRDGGDWLIEKMTTVMAKKLTPQV